MLISFIIRSKGKRDAKNGQVSEGSSPYIESKLRRYLAAETKLTLKSDTELKKWFERVMSDGQRLADLNEDIEMFELELANLGTDNGPATRRRRAELFGGISSSKGQIRSLRANLAGARAELKNIEKLLYDKCDKKSHKMCKKLHIYWSGVLMRSADKNLPPRPAVSDETEIIGAARASTYHEIEKHVALIDKLLQTGDHPALPEEV